MAAVSAALAGAAKEWAAGMYVPAYAIDDQTAIKVTDGRVEVVSVFETMLQIVCLCEDVVERDAPIADIEDVRPLAPRTPRGVVTA